MLTIDGSMGEGGGQIVRTSMAFSALLGKEITVINIRANRSKKGLRPQHVAAVSAIASICGGKLEGATTGSEELRYFPGESELQDYTIDIGTAGSIPLVLQACMLAALKKPHLHLKIHGGTNVYYSPSIDYCEYVIFPFLERMGYKITLNDFTRGFHPQGGGMADVSLSPGPLTSIDLSYRGELLNEGGICYIQNLPYKIGERLKAMSGADVIQSSNGISDGAGLFLYTEYENTVFGVDALGRRGLSSEKVASMGIDAMRQEVSSKGTIDVHAADQLFPYMALAKGTSRFKVRKISNHLHTLMELIPEFVNVQCNTSNDGGCFLVEVEPGK